MKDITLKEKIRSDFKKISRQGQKELIQEYDIHDNTSTGDESDHYIIRLNIKEESLQGDKWGNCELSKTIEKGDICKVKNLCVPSTELNDIDILRKLAFDMMNNTISLGFSTPVRESVYSEAKHQLELMGEDVSDLIEAYHIL